MTFKEWFIRQHGPKITSDCSIPELQDRISAGRAAQARLNAMRAWDEKYQASLYAWNAALAEEES